jgi:hypothetical protein
MLCLRVKFNSISQCTPRRLLSNVNHWIILCTLCICHILSEVTYLLSGRIFVYIIHHNCSTSRTCHCKAYDNSLDKLFWWLTHWMDGLVLTLVDLIIILSYVCIKVSIRSANKCIIGAFLSFLLSSLHPQPSFVGHSRPCVSRSVYETGDLPQHQHWECVFIIVSIYLAIVMCVLWNCDVPATYKNCLSVIFRILSIRLLCFSVPWLDLESLQQ